MQIAQKKAAKKESETEKNRIKKRDWERKSEQKNIFFKKPLIFKIVCAIITTVVRRCDGIGRRAGLKIQW